MIYSISLIRPATARVPCASQSFTWNVSTLSVTDPGTHNEPR